MTTLTITSDRYSREPETVESIEAFNAYCRAVGFGVPELTRRNDGRWYDDRGDAILTENCDD